MAPVGSRSRVYSPVAFALATSARSSSVLKTGVTPGAFGGREGGGSEGGGSGGDGGAGTSGGVPGGVGGGDGGAISEVKTTVRLKPSSNVCQGQQQR